MEDQKTLQKKPHYVFLSSGTSSRGIFIHLSLAKLGFLPDSFPEVEVLRVADRRVWHGHLQCLESSLLPPKPHPCEHYRYS